MARLSIRKDDDPILRKISKQVTTFDRRLKALSDDMIETMHHAEGVGLAAVQIGKLKRLITVDEYDGSGPKVYVNPVILEREGKQTSTEACLSVTDTFGKVDRPESIKVQVQDLEGNVQEFVAKGISAVILSHEIDHLDGVLFIDKAYDINLEDEEDEEDNE